MVRWGAKTEQPKAHGPSNHCLEEPRGTLRQQSERRFSQMLPSDLCTHMESHAQHTHQIKKEMLSILLSHLAGP